MIFSSFSLFLIALTSYLGILAGFFIGKIAPEERKPLKNAVHIVQHIGVFFAFGAAFMGAYFNEHTLLMATFVALVIIIIYVHTTPQGMLREYRHALSSIALGIFFVFSSDNMVIFVASGAFIFFTGLGVLETTSKLESFWKLATKTCWFLAVALLTFL